MNIKSSIFAFACLLLACSMVLGQCFDQEFHFVPKFGSWYAAPFVGNGLDVSGDWMIVGHPGFSKPKLGFYHGKVDFFKKQSDGHWKLVQSEISPFGFDSCEFFGGSVALDGGTAAVGSTLGFTSRVDIYHLNGDEQWVYQQSLEEPPIPDFVGGFGAPIDIHGDTMAIGNTTINIFDDPGGIVHIYKRQGGVWGAEQELTDGSVDSFGTGIKLTNDRILISNGNPLPKVDGEDVSLLFERNKIGQWIEVGQFAGGNASHSSSICGDTVAVSTNEDSSTVSASRSAC